MDNSILGTDGVRGRANSAPITAETALARAQAGARVLRRGGHRHRAVIGKDTRLSGYVLEAALQAGFTAAGVDVFLPGALPTPAVALLARSLQADLGVMVSTSHNLFEDNGIKLFGPDGHELSDETECAIETAMGHGPIRATPACFGRARRVEDGGERYAEVIKATFPKLFRLDGFKVVVDCANGTAYRIAPSVLWELGAEVIPIAATPDGVNINAECGFTTPDACKGAVLAYGWSAPLRVDRSGRSELTGAGLSEEESPAVEQAATQLGWSPSTPLREGLAATIAYFKRRVSVGTLVDGRRP